VFTQFNIFLVGMLTAKHTKAKRELSLTKEAFEQLTQTLDDDVVQRWTRQEAEAQEKRGDALKIYDIVAQKGLIRDSFVKMNAYPLAAPTRAMIRLKLTEDEATNHLPCGTITWLSSGIDIEYAQ
jgi:hypothetical protein